MPQTQFEIRSEGLVHFTVENPAAVFDKNTGMLFRIGEHEKMVNYYNEVRDRYKTNGFHTMVDDIEIMELPKDQNEIDNVYQKTGYIKQLFEKMTSITE